MIDIASQVRIRVLQWRDWPKVVGLWEGLCERSNASFFLTAHWVGTWLEVFGSILDPELLLFERDGDVVGACLLVYKRAWRKFIPMRRIYLNCAGEDDRDGTCVEYNRLLCLPEHEPSVTSALLSHLENHHWDEFIASGVEDDVIIAPIRPSQRVNKKVKPSFYVNLQKIREEGISYDEYLSSNTRQQIRRSIRLYEKEAGAIGLELASTEADCWRLLDELAELHQTSWTSRGKPGVFSSSRFRDFHVRLIRRTFSSAQTQLLRVSAGGRAVGLLYNFLYQGRVYFYQSGFAYTNDTRIKPGLVTHYCAVNHYLSCPDVLEYDLLAGDSQYKRSLAKEERSLLWAVVPNETWRTRIFETLRRWRSEYAGTAS